MSNPAIETALDQFVERLTPVSYRTAGVKPVSIDVSLPLEDLRAIGAQLLDAYDAARAVWMEEREAALAANEGLTGQVGNLTAQVTALTGELERLKANAKVAVASNAPTGTVTASTATVPTTTEPPAPEPPAHG